MIWWFLILLPAFEIFVLLLRVLVTLMVIWLIKFLSVLELETLVSLGKIHLQLLSLPIRIVSGMHRCYCVVIT